MNLFVTITNGVRCLTQSTVALLNLKNNLVAVMNQSGWILAAVFAPVTIPVVLTFEFVRWLRLRALSSKFRASFHVMTPICSYAILGSEASVKPKVLSSRNQNIFHFRTKYAEEGNGIYLIYCWSLSSFYSNNNTSMANINLVISDASFVHSILSLSEAFVRSNCHGENSLMMTRLFDHVGTSATGNNDARQQQKIPIHAIGDCTSIYQSVTEGSAVILIEKLHTLIAPSVGGDSSTQQSPLRRVTVGYTTFTAVDMFPILRQSSLDLACKIVMGPMTESTLEFSSKLLSFCDMVQQSNVDCNDDAEYVNNAAMKEGAVEIRRLLAVITNERKALLGARKTPTQKSAFSLADWTCSGEADFASPTDITADTCMLDSIIRQAEPTNCIITTTNDAATSSTSQPRGTSTESSTSTSSPTATPSVEELAPILFSLLTASFEAIVHSISVTLYHLSSHNEVQQRILDALDCEKKEHPSDLLPSGGDSKNDNTVRSDVSDGNVHTAQLLMTAAVKESLRLLPPVLGVTRTAVTPATISGTRLSHSVDRRNSSVINSDSTGLIIAHNDSIHCPQDTSIIIDIAAMHRRVAVWGADSHLFKIERWLPYGMSVGGALPRGALTAEHTCNTTARHVQLSPYANVCATDDKEIIDYVKLERGELHTSISKVGTVSKSTHASVTSSSAAVDDDPQPQALHKAGESHAAQQQLQSQYFMPFGPPDSSHFSQELLVDISAQIALMLVREFEFRPVIGYKPELIQTPTLKFTTGVWVNIGKRNGRF